MTEFNWITNFAGVPIVVLVFLIAWRYYPLISQRFGKKNGNGNLKVIEEKLDIISSNHLHEVTDALKRIEDAINRMNENIADLKSETAFIKARVLNNHK